MDIANCFELGRLEKPHGLKGALTAIIESDDPSYYDNLETVLVARGGDLIPYFIEEIKVEAKGRTIIRLEDITTIEQAEDFRKLKLYLPLDQLPTLAKDQFYYHEIVGYTIEDKQQGILGKVDAVYTLTGNDLIAMEYLGEEVLIPIQEGVVGEVNHKTNVLYVNLPEGLIDVYTEKEDKPVDHDED
ncbi:MAG: ribosome maturation factor RimM [Cyclobacteriaceae bacterium]